MNKVISTLAFLLITTVTLAGNIDKGKESSNTPATATQENTFEVNGLSACVGEFDTEDAVLEFNEIDAKHVLELIPLTEGFDITPTMSSFSESKATHVLELIPLTESLEESVLVDFEL